MPTIPCAKHRNGLPRRFSRRCVGKASTNGIAASIREPAELSLCTDDRMHVTPFGDGVDDTRCGPFCRAVIETDLRGLRRNLQLLPNECKAVSIWPMCERWSRSISRRTAPSDRPSLATGGVLPTSRAHIAPKSVLLAAASARAGNGDASTRMGRPQDGAPSLRRNRQARLSGNPRLEPVLPKAQTSTTSKCRSRL